MPKEAAANASVARTVFQQIHEFCVRKADAAQAAKYARFFTEGYDPYGLTDKDPEWKANRSKWTEMMRTAGAGALFDCCDLLVATGKYEEASLAILMVSDLPEFDSPEAFQRIARWFIAPEGSEYPKGIRNWAHGDVLCGEVLSRYLRAKVIGIEDLVAWRDSAHKFQRRAVPVTFCTPMNSSRTWLDSAKSYAPLFRLLEPLMSDKERVVQQGAGWLLREAWKRDAKQTEPFLMRFKDTAPRLIYQYATEKMDKAAREKFRKAR
jgi:hypothetical protein